MGGRDVDERVKLQFEYAWRWFDSHAKQRMTMFYYYLVMIGILANAWVASYDKGQTNIAVAISVLGIVTSVAAICFDMRNRQMCTAAEDILEKLETTAIYRTQTDDGNKCLVGPLSADREIGMREGQRRTWTQSGLKHKLWIRLLEGLSGAGFGLGIVMILQS